MAERPMDLKTQADIALREGDPTRQISETRTLDSGVKFKISGLALEYHPGEVKGTVGTLDPQTGRPKFNL